MEAKTKQQQSDKGFILTGNLWKVLYTLSWPAVIAMVLYGLNTVFDAYFVGKYVGETALAGVSLAYPLTQLTAGIGSLIGVGGGSVLSIAIGKGDKKTQDRLLGNTNYLTLVISLVVTVIGVIFAEQLVGLMGGSGPALIEGAAYFRVTMIGAVFSIAGLTGNMIIRAEGKMKTAALIMGAGLVVNLIFNYLLIVVFDFGVMGAAWGTNIGMIVYTLASIFYFKSGKASFPAKPFAVYRDRPLLKKINSTGMSSFIMTIMNVVQAAIILNVITRIAGESEVAFYGITFRLYTLLLTPIFGLMRALQPVIGINYGAKKYQRVIDSYWRFALISAVLIVPFWLLMISFPQGTLGLMLPDKIFSANELVNFRVYMGILPVLPIVFMTMTYFPAIGQGKPATIIGIVRQVLFYMPFMLIVPQLLGVDWVYYGTFIIDFIITLWCLILVKQSFKKMKRGGSLSID